MIGKVEEVTQTKSKKALRVKLNGVWYGAFLDSGLDQAVGKVVDAQITPDKGWGLGIGQWAYSTAPAQPAPANAPTGASRPDIAGRLTEPELRFVSNLCASAITAKTLTDPMDIGVWAKAAAQVVKEL